MTLSIGKAVGDHLYVHVSALEALPPEMRAAAQTAVGSLDAESAARVNVVKFHQPSGRLSLLAYPDFDTEPFPVLSASWTQTDSGAFRYRTYSDSSNPPILHRKELLVQETYPERETWVGRTKVAEELGLFDNARVIGFLENWQRTIAAKAYRLEDGVFVPLANEDSSGGSIEWDDVPAVRRHLTALSRTALSAPVQQLIRHGLLATTTSLFFDYGCGRGDDVASLTREGYAASGWDPFFANGHPIPDSADVVNLGFVINVIEDPVERAHCLHRAFEIVSGALVFGVMLEGGERSGTAFSDGVLTGRGTFQKYYSQDGIKDYVEQVLDQEAFMVAPGIGFVFKDKLLEQRFLAGRFRAHGLRTRLLRVARRASRHARERPMRAPRVPVPTGKGLREQALEPVLGNLWSLALDLGRWPTPDDLSVVELEGSGITLSSAIRLARKRFDMSLLARARAVRVDDLSLHFAMQRFERRPKYKELPLAMRLDVAEFFGTFSAAQAAGIRLLMQTADSEALVMASVLSSATGLGWLEGEKWLQVDMTLVERLPVVLRCYVSTGLALAGPAVRVAHLVKLHLASRKVSFFEFDDFATSALPRLARRVKANLQTQRCDVFEYGDRYPMPVLYRKSRYMHEEQEGYADQIAFDEALESIGALVNSNDEFGPSFEELQRYLSRHRVEVRGMNLKPSSKAPPLDSSCGSYLTYRHFIECGETRGRLQVPNTPQRAESFNALHGLATQVIDPVIEYFGAIELTYGFCSHELSKHITARVAPKLDQHAAEELNKAGRLICPRGGAACDFIVKDEDMLEVARWIAANVPFDRMYFYGSSRPVHVSWCAQPAHEAYALTPGPSGRLIPKRLHL